MLGTVVRRMEEQRGIYLGEGEGEVRKVMGKEEAEGWVWDERWEAYMPTMFVAVGITLGIYWVVFLTLSWGAGWKPCDGQGTVCNEVGRTVLFGVLFALWFVWAPLGSINEE